MKILCAVDGSSESGSAVEQLAAHPWPPDTAIRVITVAERVHPSVADLVATGKNVGEVQQGMDYRSDVVASSAAAKLAAAGIQAESKIFEGNPKSVIVEEAREWQADLIVVGHQGRSGLSRMLLGSVAEHVVANAPCSVLVIRHPHAAE